MAGKLIVITGLDGSGTSSLAEALCRRDSHGVLFKTPDGPFGEARELFDGEVRTLSPSAHYLYYLASVAHASDQIKELLTTRNVYCVRYLIDTVISHRVAGMDLELVYTGVGYSIHKPNATIFVHIDESIRQDRITIRGKSGLDKVLDDHNTRSRFLAEFNRYADQFHVVDNSTNDLQDAVQKAASFLPWLS
jgi:thymidylate kinase